MKKKVLSISIAALLGLIAAPIAFADPVAEGGGGGGATEAGGTEGGGTTTPVAVTQGKVTFDGELTTSTCSVQAGDEDKKVLLPKISTVDLAKKADTAGSTSFTIGVSNCATDVKAVAAHFEMTNMDPDTGNLKNLAEAATAAKNVTVQLVNSDGTGVRAGTTGRFFNVAGTGTERGATLIYGGQYYATGETTAGKVNSFARFTLAYQ
ncbi:Fimbrial protein (plasmid) [Burkholderia ambifaria MC40-6]|uniref:Fimbrial protein n=1 Tax=Burkholderia ambifaria (strain MC40-6) TaxID=398577 RepID=B1Z6J4_BURA4|nr:fimbrial protein [Burkholderia ambifaria]ACB69071.1 Fimbrial protein [Burkholderia ambifaria MC40-6]